MDERMKRPRQARMASASQLPGASRSCTMWADSSMLACAVPRQNFGMKYPFVLVIYGLELGRITSLKFKLLSTKLTIRGVS
ncbi:hypothetical protein HAX54_027627 [Datura stramonium]|uniref:Uncharacterized protein n=1 Tax=Datura stramonium TaxID=4076 RepID=A0ABS8V4X6_DATST|nr:hypothetical protein [Datura stramonium]